jgi:hypothetical protein
MTMSFGAASPVDDIGRFILKLPASPYSRSSHHFSRQKENLRVGEWPSFSLPSGFFRCFAGSPLCGSGLFSRAGAWARDIPLEAIIASPPALYTRRYG